MSTTITPAPAVKVSTDTRRTIKASVTAATALDKASGRFSKASAIALITIIDELGVGKDAGTVWTDTVAAYGEHILKPASGRAYLSHVRKAIKLEKTTADIWEFLQLDTDNPRGLSTLGAWLKEEDKTSGLSDSEPETGDTDKSDSEPETGDTDKSDKPADMSALMAKAIKALEAVSDAMGKPGVDTIDGDQWAAVQRIVSGIVRKASPKPAVKTTGKPATVNA